MKLNYSEALSRYETLNPGAKRKITRELKSYLRRNHRYALETELYKYFRIPPFIITKDKEVLFTENAE